MIRQEEIKKKKAEVEKYLLLLTDRLSISETQLQAVLKKVMRIKDEKEAVDMFVLYIEQLIEENAYALFEISEEKNDSEMPAVIASSLIASKIKEIHERIVKFAKQFVAEIRMGTKLSFYNPRVDKKTLTLAREEAELPITAKSSVNNVKALVSLSLLSLYSSMERFLMGGNGAVGYIGIRQSNYDCGLCDSLCNVLMPLDTPAFPAHSRCVCAMIPVYIGDLI